MDRGRAGARQHRGAALSPAWAGPADPAERRRWSAERRAAAREHHPDRGGDTDALLRAYTRVDARFGHAAGSGTSPLVGAGSGAQSVVVLAPPWWRRLARLVVDGAGRVRPGRTRYIDVTDVLRERRDR